MKVHFNMPAVIAVAITGILFGCSKQNDATADENSLTVNTVMATAAATCSAQGWASQNGGTTGGGTATATVVTTYATLKAAIENSSVKVIQVNGTITIPSAGRISFQDQSGKTIYGSSGAKLTSADQTASGSGIIYMKRCSNIIIRNLIFDGAGAYDVDGNDNLTVDNCNNVWVDHCEFRDGVDGNFDVKNVSDYITVSYCKFTYLKAPTAGGQGGSDDHRFANLIGSSDGATADRTHLNITFVRCWWAAGCKGRMPRVRFGKVHVVNNYFNSTASSNCVQAGFEANLLVEANTFENVTKPIDLMSNTATAVQSKNNVFTSVSGNTSGNGVNAFTPPYSFTILSAAAAKTAVTGSGGAGATLSGNTCTAF